MIKKYEVIQENEVWKLSEKVNNYIKRGWQPFGYITTTTNRFYQIMVKEFDEVEGMVIKPLLDETTKDELKEDQ